MIITKDNQKSRVHRPAYLDYIAFRIFDTEHRSSVSGGSSVVLLLGVLRKCVRVPVLRQKAAVIARSGCEASHGGKAIMDVLETYPRDELFQTPVPELASIVEKVAHLKERRQVRMFVRRDPTRGYLSCLIYLPRDRYTTAVRRRMEDILLVLSAEPRRVHGARHRVGARGAPPRGPDACRQGHGRGRRALLERELTSATRSGTTSSPT